jgi:flagellar motor switch protein FliN/FliY
MRYKMAISLSEREKNSLLTLLNLWAEANEEIFQTILNRKISFSETVIIEKSIGEDSEIMGSSTDIFTFPLTVSSGILGSVYISFVKEDLARFLDLIIGGDGSSPMMEFDDLHFSVLEESINQIVGTLESILSDNLSRKINVRLKKPDLSMKKLFNSWEMLYITHTIKIEGVSDIRMEISIPADFCVELIDQVEDNNERNKNSQSTMRQVPQTQNFQGGSSMFRKASFPQFTPSEDGPKDVKMNLIMDIPLEMTVILGKTSISIKELVELGPGSVVELDKLAGEPVELMVNDRLVGFGEVIVIDESFGIRVIDVVDNMDPGGYSGGKRR